MFYFFAAMLHCLPTQNRSIAEDLVSMICADGLVTARSSLKTLVNRHSLATRKYFPYPCTKDLNRQTTRPGVQVRLEYKLFDTKRQKSVSSPNLS